MPRRFLGRKNIEIPTANLCFFQLWKIAQLVERFTI